MNATETAAAVSSAASRSTDFGSTVFDVVAPTTRRRPGLESAFDVCHVGVVLRAILFVHATMAIGVVFGASSFAVWLSLVAAGASVALPAVLLWLLVVCGLKQPLARSPLPLQWIAVIALGAIAAFSASRLIAALLPDANAAGLGPHRDQRLALVPRERRRHFDGLQRLERAGVERLGRGCSSSSPGAEPFRRYGWRWPAS